MDKKAKDELNLNERSPEELHAALYHFERKWLAKVDRLSGDDRSSRF